MTDTVTNRHYWSFLENRIYLLEGGALKLKLVNELSTLVDKRFTILIEDAIPEIAEIKELTDISKKNNLSINLILGARTNEWNVYGSTLETRIDKDWELRNLSEKEIIKLLKKLNEHDSIGELKQKSKQEQIAHFKLTADRQLLVALHEATYGKPFEKIVFDEYQNIVPKEAQILYIDICTLNRLGVGVRAGLISRISGINFTYFSEKLLKPLEHVVKVHLDQRSKDYIYKSRHSNIAKLVFDQVMTTQDQRAEQIIRMLRYLNVDYSNDDQAFSKIIKGKTVAELFSNKNLGERIYKKAIKTGASQSYINHQNAVFELNHPTGDIRKAFSYIRKAEGEASKDRSLAHTKATIYRKLSLNARTLVERERLRSEALSIIKKLLNQYWDQHSIHTYIQLQLDELQEIIPDSNELESDLDDSTKRVFVRVLDQCEDYKDFPMIPICHH